MATLQPMVCLLLASCLILLGRSEAQYPGYYQRGYPFYPHRQHPLYPYSYPYSGWPLNHARDIHQHFDKRLPLYHHPAPLRPHAPKYDGLHQHYHHVPVVRPIAHPRLNVYNIFDGGITKQTAASDSDATAGSPTGDNDIQATNAESSSPTGDNSIEADNAESSREVAINREVSNSASASGEQGAIGSPITVQAPAPASAPKVAEPISPSDKLDNVHAPRHHAADRYAIASSKHVDPHSFKSASKPASHSAKKMVAAAPAFTNHRW